MVISYYVFYLPYTALWHLNRLLKRKMPTVFYCRDLLDWHVMEPVYQHFPEAVIVSDKSKTIKQLRSIGLDVKRLPVFPKIVVMCRHSYYKFPCKSVTLIGMRHGAYHFKRLTNAKNYNRFSLYLFTSKADLQAAKKIGVTCGKSIGFPKLDPAFDGTYDKDYLEKLKEKLELDPSKTTILLTATWYRSEMSAILEWYKRLNELVKYYNVLVTLHPWTDKVFVRRIKKTEGVILIAEDNVVPYIMIADVCIGDSSSILAECSALDKPMITFDVELGPRAVPETEEIINKISYRITSFPQLFIAIEYSLKNRSELAKERAKANQIFFDKLDGKAGLRAAKEIKEEIRRSKR